MSAAVAAGATRGVMVDKRKMVASGFLLAIASALAGDGAGVIFRSSEIAERLSKLETKIEILSERVVRNDAQLQIAISEIQRLRDSVERERPRR